nr:zinc knuckle CX2CX4HX4C [Tanacetum cinerariifolium]
MDKEEVLINNINNSVTSPNAKTNNVDISDNNEEFSKNGSKKTYDSATKNTKWRMWNRFGFKEIVDNDNGNWLFSFSTEQGLVDVADQNSWMVKSKPLTVYKWDFSLGLNKVEPTKLPIWVKLSEVPMEAWTTECLSALSSSMGKPMILDNMTTCVCKNGVGRTMYARVLVEIKAVKRFKEVFELQYRDKNQNVKGTKTVKRSSRADKEKERNDRLNGMEGIVEDVLEDESVAARILVANELNGQASPVTQLDSIGNIFTTTLTSDEANAIVVEVSDHVIKNAMFGIDDCKSPWNMDYVKVSKDSLNEFSRVLGLVPNLNKSTIFFGNVSLRDQRSILNMVPLQVGTFLVKYLGVALITKRLGREECNQLLDKVKNKIKHVWNIVAHKESIWVKCVHMIKLRRLLAMSSGSNRLKEALEDLTGR